MISEDVNVRVTKASKEEFEIEISPKREENGNPSDLESIAELTLCDSDKKTETEESSITQGKQPMLEKCRTLSESSGDEVVSAGCFLLC